MVRKVIAFWLSLAMVFGLVVVLDVITDFTPAVMGTIHYVNETGSGGAFTKIQDAINASKDGDTIYVYNGTYYENVVVNKSINLIGEDRDNTTIDGGGVGVVVYISVDWVNITGFSVTNTGGGSGIIGINLDGVWNCRVANNNVSNNDYGIFLDMSRWNKVIGNNVSSNSFSGINLVDSRWNNITGNNVSDSWYGIRLRYSDDNEVYGNNASDNGYAIYLQFSQRNVVTGNVMIGNGIFLWGQSINYWNTHTIDTSNTVSGKPVYYWKNQIGGTIPPGAGQVILADCENVNISNQELTFGSAGIELGFSSNNNITNNNASNNNEYGIFLYISDGNNITGNNFSSNKGRSVELFFANGNKINGNNISNNLNGIYFRGSTGNNITGNNVNSNIQRGVYLYQSSDDNIIRSNNISSNNMAGIALADWCQNNMIEDNIAVKNNNQGIAVYLSSYNDISRNNLSFNGRGIWIGMSNFSNIRNNIVFNNSDIGISIYDDSYYNTISDNNVSNNLDGISIYSSYNNSITNNDVTQNNQFGFYLWSSLNNTIHYNNIMDNSNQAYDDSNKGNKWDNGYPLGGNYWSDYGGVDNFKGPNQDIPGSDGIGDTNYSIDSDSVDNYPLMQPYIPLENYTILREGWNLISIPLIQVNKNLTKVLEMIDGYYDAVQWYDITDPNDPWKHNKIGKPYGNDLTEINETMGFWIYINQPEDVIFLYNGTQPTSNQTITLHPGWNLVGYPSITSYNRTEGLNNLTFGMHVDSIWTYDAATQTWKELGLSDYFEIGKGYWIHAQTSCVWEVPI